MLQCERHYARKRGDALVALAKLKDETLGFDIETTGVIPQQDHLLLVQLSDAVHTAVLHWEAVFDDKVRTALERIFNGREILKVIFSDFEALWTRQLFGKPIQRVWDAKVAEQILRMGHLGPDITLADVTWRYHRIRMSKEAREGFIGRDWEHFEPTQVEIDYGALDAEVMPGIFKAQWRQIKDEHLVKGTMLRMNAIPAVADMELGGALIDMEGWRKEIEIAQPRFEQRTKELAEVLTPEILKVRERKHEEALQQRYQYVEAYAAIKRLNESMVILEKDCEVKSGKPTGQICDSHWCLPTGKERRAKINELNAAWKVDWCKAAGLKEPPPIPKMDLGPINLNSGDQLIAAYGELGIELPDTTRDTLKRVVDLNPTIKPLLEWKEDNKILTTYGPSLLEKARYVDGRPFLYGRYNMVVNTGRQSSSNPNKQNIPRLLRKYFVAGVGEMLLILDYSQIELRILAELSGDENLSDDFWQHHDPHTAVAVRNLGMSYEEGAALKKAIEEFESRAEPLTNEMARFHTARRLAKVANYGVAYGMGNKELIATFSGAYPQAWEYLQGSAYHGWKHGYTRTMSGLKRRYDNKMPEGLTKREQWSFRASVERRAKNAPIQGTCSDIVYLAMERIWEEFVRNGPLSMWNAVHDELDLRGPEDAVREIAPKAQRIAEEAGEAFLKSVPVEAGLLLAQAWTK